MVIPLVMALLLIGGSLLALARALKTLRASRNRAVAGVAFALSVGLGLALGVRFCFLGEFALGERLRIQGAPIPLVVFVDEGTGWTDFVKPPLVGYPCIVANVLFPVGLVALMWLAAAARIRKTHE